MGKLWKQWETMFLVSKITADGDCSHEIKRCLLLGRKAMTNLGSILKSRDITLLTKVCLVKAMVFLVVMYGCESWTIKKAECRRIDTFELWCWKKLLRVPWISSRSNQSYRKSVLNVLWKDSCWSWNSNTLTTWCEELTPWKRPWCWERLMAGGEGDNRGWDGWMASPTSRVYPNSCPLSQWCHPTISFSVIPFSSHLQTFPASGSFLGSHFFASAGQSIGVSASASVLPMRFIDFYILNKAWVEGINPL